jgi:excisionase family DNA binding protein
MKDHAGERFLTPEEVAERLVMAPRTVKEWLRQGKLKGIKIAGKTWRIREEDLAAFLQQQAAKSQDAHER